MATKNEVIGHWTCSLGGRAEVTQTKKAGRHFNTRCDCCGFSQATGAKRQQLIWDQAQFIAGKTVAKPSNVSDSKQSEPVVTQPESEQETNAEQEYKPKSEPEPEQEATLGDYVPLSKREEVTEEVTEQVPEGSGVGGKLMAGAAFCLALGVGIWMN